MAGANTFKLEVITRTGFLYRRGADGRTYHYGR